MVSPPMTLLTTEAYDAITKFYMLMRNNGKLDPFDNPMLTDRDFPKLLWGVKNLTCCNDMTCEEQYAIAVSMSTDEPITTCRILSTCDFFDNYRCIDVGVQLSEDISGKTSWETILTSVKFSFVYVVKK